MAAQVGYGCTTITLTPLLVRERPRGRANARASHVLINSSTCKPFLLRARAQLAVVQREHVLRICVNGISGVRTSGFVHRSDIFGRGGDRRTADRTGGLACTEHV